MPSTRIVPAELAFHDGVPYASRYGAAARAIDCDLAHARHVFLGGNRLPQRWQQQELFTILETGFGAGLNFLATWAAWHADPARSDRLHYVAIEPHPFTAADLAQLHTLWPELAERPALLRAAWPVLMPGFQRVLLDGGRVVLTLIFGDIADCLPQLETAANAFYVDGLAPEHPPGLLVRLGRLAAPEATAATANATAEVHKALTQAGFVCERRQAVGGNPEMLTARFAPPWKQTAPQRPRERHAVVIGAGIAGSAACERLTARGWDVTLIERHAGPAEEASGNLAGIVMPLPSRDDNQASRLARAAYLFAQRHWAQLGGIGQAFAGEACGVLQLAADAEHARMQQAVAAASDPAFLRWLDARAVRQSCGLASAHGGWLFEQGGWVTPGSLCKAMLEAGGVRLQRCFNASALTLEQIDGQWEVRAANGALLASAPTVIIAGGHDAGAFAQTRDLPLSAIRGQVTHIPADLLPELPLVVCGDGYVTRPSNGLCSVGASYDMDDEARLRMDSQEENLRRLTGLLPGTAIHLPDLPLAGRVGFRCVSPDRLPLVGALPDTGAPIRGSRLRDVPRFAGLHGLLAYGSRGLIWAPFMAELLAAQLAGEALPVERELVDALDPARFALKAHRREQG